MPEKPKHPSILTHGAIEDFVELLPEPELREQVKKAIREFYQVDHPDRPARVLPVRRKRRAKKR